MNKPATPDHEIDRLILRRWSPRAFSDRSVAPQTLRSVLEAARWAASSFNEQPWRYLVARREDGEEFAKLLDCLVPGNQSWARHAPVLLLSVAKATFSKSGKPNRHALHDVGLATAQLTLQATALGLGVHQMAGFSVERARQVFGIPDDFDPAAALALGYPGDPAQLEQPMREREAAPRVRRAQSETVFAGAWDRAWEP